MPDSLEDNTSCRICMDSTDSYVSLFTHDLSVKVMEVADVQVDKDDGLPETICTQCETDLEKCYEFRLKVQVSDKRFRDNIKYSKVDIEECNIKEEREMDDGNSDNLDDKDSIIMDDDNCNDEPDVVLKNTEEIEEPEPDPMNHVVVIEEKERKVDISEDPDPLRQDEAMMEVLQVKKVEEPPVDPFVCMKEETEIMDIESLEPETFGPSSSVGSTELPSSFPILSSGVVNPENQFEMKSNQQPSVSSEIIKANQQQSTNRKKQIPLSPALSSQVSSTCCLFSTNQQKIKDFMLIPQPEFIDSFCNVSFASNNVTADPVLSVGVGSNIAYPCRTLNHFSNFPSYTSSPHENIQNISMDPLGTTEPITDSTVYPKTNSETQENKQTPSADVEVIKETVTESKDSMIIQSSSSPQTTPEAVEQKGENEFFCSVCNVDCWSYDLLQEHKSGKEFICRGCTAIFNNHQELESHFFSHKRKFTCEFCRKVFYVQKDLMNHKRTEIACKKKSPRESCKICHNRFVHEANLLIHMEQKHPDTHLQGYACFICQRSFKNDITYTWHMKKCHMVYESIECDICHNILSGPSALKHHIKDRHIQTSEICPICKKMLSSEKSLKNHMEGHSGKEIVCDICGAVSKGKVAFKLHMYDHENRHQSCNICNETFNSRKEKKKHWGQKHRKSIPVICELCGKEYKTLAVLKYHMLMKHSDDKPYACGDCGAAFKTKTVLKTHSRIHTDVKKYSCKHCGEGFRWKQTFDKHVLKCQL